MVNHVAVPPYAADHAHLVQIAAIRRALDPTAPQRGRHRRWQPAVPHMLRVLTPGDQEELWPVQELVVHLQHQAPHRTVAAMEDSAADIALRLSTNCALRLPTYCPAEPGAPLHLFLHHSQLHDPWNDPDVPPTNWALVDLRRILRPPRPPYIMLPVPRIFDLAWLREALALGMPDLEPVASAYMGQDMIVEHCSPHGNVPLLTVFPARHFVFQPSFLVDCILDTHALLDVRPGFQGVTRVDRSRERQAPAPTRRAAPGSTATSAQTMREPAGPRPFGYHTALLSA